MSTPSLSEMTDGTIDLSITNQWGRITDEESEILTEITITNSSATYKKPIPIATKTKNIGLRYTAQMNGVEIGKAEQESIELAESSTKIQTSTSIDNDMIPTWWATHVNNDERTTLEIRPSLDIETPIANLSLQMPEWKKEIETSIAEKLSTTEAKTKEAYGREVLEIERVKTGWGEATIDETPMNLTARIKNPMSIPLVFTKVGYTVKLNDIKLGKGETTDSIKIPAGETKEIETQAIFSNEQIEKWWVSHIDNFEYSEVEIDFTGKIEFKDYKKEFPLYSYTDYLETDILDFEETNTYRFL